jgi:hypothetical protein
MNFCKIFAQTLMNERKKQEFIFKSSNFENCLLQISFYFHFLSLFSPELLSITINNKKNPAFCIRSSMLENIQHTFFFNLVINR